MRGARRAVCARVWRAAGEPLVWRHAGVAHFLRSRADGAAAFARRVFVAEPDDWRGFGADVPAHGDAGVGGRGRSREGHRGARHGDGDYFLARGGRGDSRDGRLRKCVLSFHECEGLQRDCGVACAQEGRTVCESVLHANPPDVHPGGGVVSKQAHADERIAAQRRTLLGAEKEGRHASAKRHPGGRARLLFGADVSSIRKPRAP